MLQKGQAQDSGEGNAKCGTLAKRGDDKLVAQDPTKVLDIIPALKCYLFWILKP